MTRLRTIWTARLELRGCTMADLDDLWRLWTDPEVRRYLWDGEALSRERAAQTLADSLASAEESGVGFWAVRQRHAAPLIGFCGFRPTPAPGAVELLYGFAPGLWSHGIATEAVRAVVRYAFEELKVGRLVAATDVPNRASVRVLEKAGLTRVSSAGSQGRESLLHFQLVDDKYVPGDWPYRVAHC